MRFEPDCLAGLAIPATLMDVTDVSMNGGSFTPKMKRARLKAGVVGLRGAFSPALDGTG